MNPVVLGKDIWQWPEFRALVERLGVEEDDNGTADLMIWVPIKGIVTIERRYYPRVPSIMPPTVVEGS